jgi:hypothetical protein
MANLFLSPSFYELGGFNEKAAICLFGGCSIIDTGSLR